MKKILLAAALLIGSVATSQAQSASTEKPSQAQLQFVSQTNVLEAAVVRNNPDKAKEMANTLLGLMQEHMLALRKSPATSGVDINQKVQLENRTINEYKVLLADGPNNGKMLVQKARLFLQFY